VQGATIGLEEQHLDLLPADVAALVVPVTAVLGGEP
jgi:hypothetical protein